MSPLRRIAPIACPHCARVLDGLAVVGEETGPPLARICLYCKQWSILEPYHCPSRARVLTDQEHLDLLREPAYMDALRLAGRLP